MRKSRKRFTLERHAEAGQTLYEARSYLVHFYVEFANTYGVTHKASRLTEKAYEAIDALRCEMDEVVARETTCEEWESQFLWETYYPGTKPENSGHGGRVSPKTEETEAALVEFVGDTEKVAA